MQLHWIWLNSRKGVGPIMAMNLLEFFPDIQSLYRAGEAELSPILRKDSLPYRSLMDKSLRSAETLLEECRRKQISVLTYGDADYPNRLKQIADPPLVLFYRGRLPNFDCRATLGVVGTRKATTYGLSTARRLGRELATEGALVVSGLAGGIDSAAMAGAVSAGGITVGVLGCGADIVYPSDNGALYGKVMEHGCVITEFVPGTLPAGRNFPKRNRIISGLSSGVVVVEAPARSGALITASFALEQGRDVFAVPGNLDSPESAGTLSLIRQGAGLAESGKQIMEEYQNLFEPCETAVPMTAQEPQISLPPQKKVDKLDKKPYSDKHKVLPNLTADEKAVYSALTTERIQVDELIAQLDLGTSRALVALTMLEVKGLVQQFPGKYYSLALSAR